MAENEIGEREVVGGGLGVLVKRDLDGRTSADSGGAGDVGVVVVPWQAGFIGVAGCCMAADDNVN